jgi:hypothetical protein
MSSVTYKKAMEENSFHTKEFIVGLLSIDGYTRYYFHSLKILMTILNLYILFLCMLTYTYFYLEYILMNK